jgi:RNA-directed DNA polymerase
VKTKLLDLNIKTKEDLALVLGFKVSDLEAIAKNKWRHIRHHKKDVNGKIRNLYTADQLLESVHEKIDKKILNKISFPSEIKGGVKGRSQSSNAAVHQKARNIAHFDIKNFFPNTPPKKIFLSFLGLGISPEPSRLLTTLVTGDHLVQGFITSPKVSAMVLLRLNKRLSSFLKRFGVRHTIWIDDIVLSGEYPLKKLKSGIKTMVKEEGYILNEKKTKISYKNIPQKVTGVVINHDLSVENVKVSDIERTIHICTKYGIEGYLKNNKPGLSADKFKMIMAGNLGNLLSVNPQKYVDLHKRWRAILDKEHSLAVV